MLIIKIGCMYLKFNEFSFSFNFPMAYISIGGIMYTIMYTLVVMVQCIPCIPLGN